MAPFLESVKTWRTVIENCSDTTIYPAVKLSQSTVYIGSDEYYAS
jgi:hypothetical protein